MQDRYALATSPKRESKDRQHEHGGLPDELEPLLTKDVQCDKSEAVLDW